MTGSPMTIDDVREMLVDMVAKEASILSADVATDRLFTSYGLDSMAALSLGMDIEESCGLDELPENLMWEYPTIDTLVDAIWSLINGKPADHESGEREHQ
jgi:acyl carrier protein